MMRRAAILGGARKKPAQPYPMAAAHVTWNDAAWMLDNPSDWMPVTTLRDPLERTVSHYRYLRQKARYPIRVNRFQTILEEVSARPLRELVLDETSNFHGWTMPVQTIYLGANLQCAITECRLADEVTSAEFQRAALEIALERLERMAWIGIVETLDRDLETLAFIQGWRHAGATHVNRTRPDDEETAAFSELDLATRRVLVDRLTPDYLLLESGREIAAERYREMIETAPPAGGLR